MSPYIAQAVERARLPIDVKVGDRSAFIMRAPGSSGWMYCGTTELARSTYVMIRAYLEDGQ